MAEKENLSSFSVRVFALAGGARRGLVADGAFFETDVLDDAAQETGSLAVVCPQHIDYLLRQQEEIRGTGLEPGIGHLVDDTVELSGAELLADSSVRTVGSYHGHHILALSIA